MKSKFVAIRNAAKDKTIDLYFLDIIQDTYDWWTGMTESAVAKVIEQVNAAQPTTIRCIIDSEGGDAIAGLAIYNFLKASGKEIEVDIIGLAGSIASVIAMAASPGKLRIARNAFMMIHEAWGVAAGNSNEIRQYADLVDKVTAQVVDVYVQRTSKTSDAITALIENGDYWMTGSEAVEQGFADQTINDTAGFKVAARLQAGLDPHYQNVPAFIMAQTDKATLLQNQFDEMKTFIKNLFDAMRGVKPEATATQEVVNQQVADAIEAPMQALADEIERTIDNRVANATKPLALEGDETLAVRLTNMSKQIKDLEKKNGELEQAISNKVGNSTSTKPETEKKHVGSFEE